MISFLNYSYIVHDYAFWNPFSQYTITLLYDLVNSLNSFKLL